MLQSLNVVSQPGSQMSYTHLLLLQGREVLLRGGGPEPMVVAADRVLCLSSDSTHTRAKTNCTHDGALKSQRRGRVSYRGVLGCVRAVGPPSGALIRTGKVCVLDASLWEHLPPPPPVPTERLTGGQITVTLRSYRKSLKQQTVRTQYLRWLEKGFRLGARDIEVKSNVQRLHGCF